MRVLKGAFIGLLLLLICTPVFGAEVVKLGFFDMQSIIDRSELGKDGAQKFEAEKEKVLDDEFTKKEHIWSEDVKKTKAQEFLLKQREYKRFEMEANRKLRQQELQLIKPIKDKVFEIINRIGKEEGYTMIWEMRETGLTYAPPSLELTDRVIRELNEIAAKEARGKQ